MTKNRDSGREKQEKSELRARKWAKIQAPGVKNGQKTGPINYFSRKTCISVCSETVDNTTVLLLL
jgi:hypothetical protein